MSFSLGHPLTSEELSYSLTDNGRGIYYFLTHGEESSLTVEMYATEENGTTSVSTTTLGKTLVQSQTHPSEGQFHWEYRMERKTSKIHNIDVYAEERGRLFDKHACFYQHGTALLNLTSLQITHHAYQIRGMDNETDSLKIYQLADRAIKKYYEKTLSTLIAVDSCYLLLFLISEYNYLRNLSADADEYVHFTTNCDVIAEIAYMRNEVSEVWEKIHGFSLL